MWPPYKILCVTLHILLLPLSLTLFIFLVLYKLIVVSVAKSFHDFEGPIPSQSSLFILDQIWTKPSSTVTVVIQIQGNFSKEALTQDFQRTYDLRDAKGQRCYRELAYYPVQFMGYGFWKKFEKFRMADRIKMVQVAHKSSIVTEKHLVEIVEGLQRKPFEVEEPLWDINLLVNYTGDPNRTLVIWRYHHLLADGVSIVKFFYAMTGSSQLPESFTRPSDSMTTWDQYASNALSKAAFFAKLCTVGIIEYLEACVFYQDRNLLNFDPKGNFKVVGEWRCSTGTAMLHVDKLKIASRRYKCSIVHVILAGVSAGLERYMEKYHGKDGGKKWGEELGKGFHYIVPLPVPGHPNMRLVNHWCVAKFYSKPNFQQTSERIQYFQEETQRSVSSSLPITSALIFKYFLGFLPPSLGKYLATVKASSTVALSNIVGPQEKERLLAGCTLTDMLFWMPIPQQSMALSVGAISCNGGLRLCFTADNGCISDQSRLDDLTMMITEELLAICKMT